MEHCQQVICLRWGIHHENLISAFEQQLNADKFTDVTVYVNGGRFRCHRLVLLASSEYFRKIFYHSPFEETIVCLKDVRYEVFGLVLRYLYTGEVCVPLRNVQELWKAVALLKVIISQILKNNFHMHLRNILYILIRSTQHNLPKYFNYCLNMRQGTSSGY